MAELVGAFGVPHTPIFPQLVASEGPTSSTGQLFAEVRMHLEALDPNLVVVFSSDHLNTFFFDQMPTFCIGASDVTHGPNDALPGVTRTKIPGSEALGRHVHSVAIDNDFDVSISEHYEIDHSILVPLHFLTPAFQTAVVPVYINGLAPPLPSAKRCYALGRAVAGAIRGWPESARVAIVGSGTFSLELGGPRVGPGLTWGIPDPRWAKQITDSLAKGDVETLLNAATTDRLRSAGNVAGELLNWIALLGAIDGRKPVFLEPQELGGSHAYAAWRWD